MQLGPLAFWVAVLGVLALVLGRARRTTPTTLLLLVALVLLAAAVVTVFAYGWAMSDLEIDGRFD